MLRVKSNGELPVVKLKSEFCAAGRSNCVQKILSFLILNKCYFVVARSSGLVQLYERQKTKTPTIALKLVKEWKNSTVAPNDPVVAVGCFRNQFMYTCSNAGKLVIRDLINDDADDSVKTYLIDAPVSCMLVSTCDHNMRVLVAAGGRNNELKLYDLDFAAPSRTYYNRMCTVGFLRSNHLVRLSSAQPDYRNTLRRSYVQRFSSYTDCSRVSPVMTAASTDEYPYGTLLLMANWILSTAFLSRRLRRMVCSGTQFGDLLIYDATEPFCSEQAKVVLHLSQFPINLLYVFPGGRLLLYTDTVSKVGVIDVETFEVLSFYDYLKIGPSVSSRVYASPNCLENGAHFDPFYLLASTVNGDLVIYRLLEHNHSELKLAVHECGVVPNFELTDADAYQALEDVFGDKSENVSMKRRRFEQRI